jgi:hypothetical protein
VKALERLGRVVRHDDGAHLAEARIEVSRGDVQAREIVGIVAFHVQDDERHLVLGAREIGDRLHDGEIGVGIGAARPFHDRRQQMLVGGQRLPGVRGAVAGELELAVLQHVARGTGRP